MTEVIYVGPHPRVKGDGIDAKRHGPPVDVKDSLARSLIARGDFIKYVPEPRRAPVVKSRK